LWNPLGFFEGFAMTRLAATPEEISATRPQPSAGAAEGNQPPHRNGDTSAGATGGTLDGSPSPATENQVNVDTASAAGNPSKVDRAQVLADQIGKKVADFTLSLGARLVHAGAVVREAVEDVWAEAQGIRRGKQ
jgi:hypothetical protein